MVTAWGSGAPVGLLRFIVFIPCGVLYSIASNHWNVIRKNPELHSGLYGFAVVHGEQFAHRWTKFGYFWNFAVWIPDIVAPAPFSVVFAMVDTAIAILMSISASNQTAYAPHNIDYCGGTASHDMWLPAGNNESFYEASARLNATQTNSFQMCKSYVVEWQYGIVISVFYTLIAFINVMVCAYEFMDRIKKPKKQDKSFAKWVWNAAVALPVVICTLLVTVLYVVPVLFFRCLPISAKAKTRYMRRYTMKSGQAIMQVGQVQLEKLKCRVSKKRGMEKRYQGGVAGEPTGLADFLGIYDILILVVENLHYADIVNLSLACKSVRESVLPADDYERRLLHFNMYTCDEPKTQCWVCANQICATCTYEHKLPQTTIYHHLDACNTYCNPCYKTLHSNPLRIDADPQMCVCAPVTPTPNRFQRHMNGPAFYSSRQRALPLITRHICLHCAYLTEEQVLEQRKKRTESEVRGTGKRGEDKCKKCAVELGGGPRWWVCGKCNLECGSWCHGAWGKNKKKKKKKKKEKMHGEMILVGEDAV
ncbi:hypothetical protein K504DRAFT_439067 [Pleomassaria siparia CBS 279.74]|uniref:F-box domain-containing protein n=1 Tax=Pleomassaria siparia CBS 279.74 TaxID=1314801 RepID=A0A6G1JYX4_9PLEO|nr:hypothetical protein K504DRAFT_439067 [Pleomassaria siparia CBS 279.74]